MKSNIESSAGVEEVKAAEKATETAAETAAKTEPKKAAKKEAKKEPKKAAKKDTEKAAETAAPKEQGPPQSPDSKKYKYLIKDREVRKHVRSHKFVVALMIFLAVTIVLGGAVYGIMSMVHYNNLKVLVDKQNPYIFSLSSNPNFTDATEMMSLGGPKFMDNITLMDIFYLIPDFESHNGTYGDRNNTNYIAATFYLKNITSKEQKFRESIIITEVTKRADNAMRIMVIKNGERTVYAKEKPNGDAEEVVPGQFFTRTGIPGRAEDVWMTVPFISPKHVCYNTGLMLQPGAVVKYTVLVWLEGWDEECVDAILGGTVRLEFQFAQQG